jgi:hypothetical protein
MIFDNDNLTPLIMVWQQTRDLAVLDRILSGCQPLVEVIVSQYDPADREDLLQECKARVVYAIPHFDVRRSTAHNYLTTVVINTCRTWYGKEGKHECDGLDDADAELYVEYDDDGGILEDLISRNRARFPQIIAAHIDNATEIIYMGLCNGEKRNVIINKVIDNVAIVRKVAYIIYDSTVVYLRMVYRHNVRVDDNYDGDYTLLQELRDLVGKSGYDAIRIAMAGMTIRIP